MAIDRSRSPLPRLTSTTRPTPPIDPIEAFSTAAHEQTRMLWLRPTTGEALVGIGSAATLGTELPATWHDLLADHDSRRDGYGPVLLGGFRFDPSAPASGLWAGLGSTRLVLPRRMLRIRDGQAWQTANTIEQPRPPTRLQAASGSPRTGLTPDAWCQLVSEVAGGIRTGELGVRKVVLARTEQIALEVSIESALRRLASAYPGCTVFAFAEGDACFLGATPERLVKLHDGTATTMALAGSGPRGMTPDEDAQLARELLGNPKERIEHAVVVDALREDLAPVCTRVVAEAKPRVHTLANVQHLLTPIRAQVKPGCTVLDLVARLHPTPAVGGYPRQRALEVIREREALDRGWYAAPFGWVDASGHGEFVVGLRSALVRKGVATLFAGCGIVGDSDPETELAESRWKLQPMLTALGER